MKTMDRKNLPTGGWGVAEMSEDTGFVLKSGEELVIPAGYFIVRHKDAGFAYALCPYDKEKSTRPTKTN